MSSLDYFSQGFTRAFARLNEQQSRQNVQHAQKVESNVGNTITTGKINTTNDTITTEFSDRLCKTTIVQEMTILIKQRKIK